MVNKGIVSVIVPVYNAELYLGRCVESLLHQSYTNFELLLIDDGSTDESASICDAYSLLDKRVRTFHQQNAGASAARNRGLDEALGRWVCFVDADDYVGLDYVADLVLAANDETMVVVQGLTKVNNSAKILNVEVFPSVCFEQKDFGKMLEVFQLLDYGFTVSKLYPLSLLNINQIRFNTKIIRAEDLLFFLQSLTVADKVSLISRSNYNYVISNSVLSVANFSYESERMLFVLLKTLLEKQFFVWNLNSKYFTLYLGRILMQYVLGLYDSHAGYSARFRRKVLCEIKLNYREECLSYNSSLRLMKIIRFVILSLPSFLADYIICLLINKKYLL